MSKLQNYLRGALAGGASEGIILAAGLVNVWVLTQVLGKEEFGIYAFVTAIFAVLGLLGSGGLDRLIAFRVAETKPVPGSLVGGAYASTGLLGGLVISSIIALLVWTTAGATIDDFGASRQSLWVLVGCVALPIQTVGVIFADWFIANRRIPEVRMLATVRPVANAVLLLGVYLFWPDRRGAALALIASAILGLITWVAWAGLGQLRKPQAISGWEFRYSLKLTLAKLGSMGVERVDILMIGMMVSNAATAEYAIAHRLARLGGLGNRLLGPVFTPRLRYALANDEALEREYAQNRLFELVPALLVLAVLVLASPLLLSLFFGDNQGAMGLLPVLALVYVAGAAFGPNGRYLNFAGFGSATLATTVILLVLTVLLNLALIPLWGALGAAIATFLSVVLGNTIVSALILRWTSFNTFDSSVLGVALVATVAVFLLVGLETGRILTAGIIAVDAVLLLYLRRGLWRR